MSKLRRYKKVDTSLSHLCTFAPVKDPAKDACTSP